jgi:hypothetical protein
MRARQDNARAEAIDRVARSKRRIGAVAVLGFGALIGVVGIAGAKGASSPGGQPASGRSITSPSDRDHAGTGGLAGGGASGGSDDQVAPGGGFAPGEVPDDDGYFSGQGGGYGFGDAQGGQSQPHGQSNVS